MRKILALAVTSLLAATIMTGDAEAKRRGGRGIPIIIPGFGSSESIVLVKDLPNIDALRRPDGKYIDLGYLHQRSGGKWVGYIGSDQDYINFSPESLKVLMQLSGMSAMPPVPKKSASSGSSGGSFGMGWWLAVLGIGFAAFRIFSFVKGLFQFGARAAGKVTKTSAQDFDFDNTPPAQGSRLEERMEAAAKAYAAGQATSQSTSAPAYRPVFGQQSAPAFGKR